MKQAAPLDKIFTPKLVSLELDVPAGYLEAVEKELLEKSQTDSNKCFGYFPALKGKDGISTELPASQKFAESANVIELGGKKLDFNFVRMSLIKQEADSPFHLDSDSKTAITGDTSTISDRLVWRLLLNLSDQHPRTLSYLNIDPFSIDIDFGDGYINAPKESVEPDFIETLAIPKRQSNSVSGILFCASRVLHTGKDDKYGHFVAGYGTEESS